MYLLVCIMCVYSIYIYEYTCLLHMYIIRIYTCAAVINIIIFVVYSEEEKKDQQYSSQNIWQSGIRCRQDTPPLRAKPRPGTCSRLSVVTIESRRCRPPPLQLPSWYVYTTSLWYIILHQAYDQYNITFMPPRRSSLQHALGAGGEGSSFLSSHRRCLMNEIWIFSTIKYTMPATAPITIRCRNDYTQVCGRVLSDLCKIS